ncbi:MAG: transcription antitermination factor NusB, partial [Chitinophagaceae bacterium]|nr:transcription antitermination factor NusB [Chitinophagaceae bacterium]
MISRRNIRVKVMQTLYTLQATEPDNTHLATETGLKILNEKLAYSLQLFTTTIAYVAAVAQYAEVDARFRSSKYVPSNEDKNVNIKIAGNDFIWKTIGDDTFQLKLKSDNLEHSIDEAWVKKLYQKLCTSEQYKSYIAEDGRDPKSEKAIIRYIWTELIINNEAFQEYLQDEISGWEDDKDMIYILMDNFFKSSSNINFMSLLTGEKLDYAKTLLATAIEKADYCMELI